MSYPETKMACVSNLWVRQMCFAKAGDSNEGHVHNYDHITLLASGSVAVDIDGVVTNFKAPQMIYITKGKSHYITALEDNTVACCIHALRNGEAAEDIIDPSMIPSGVNAFDTGLARSL
jgi:quercetin dioxygenase-like cupin family protein